MENENESEGKSRVASVIAIDGPAAVGKSTVGKRVAVSLGYLFLDTGAIYRALTLLALQRGVDVRDGPALADLAARMDLEIEPAPPATGRLYTVRLEGVDRTVEIRSHAVDAAVSAVSEHPEVRAAVLPIQRKLGQARAVVAGRDIGTVVLPGADLKIYLDASEEARASRRLPERRRDAPSIDVAAVLGEIRRRDRIDSSRAVAPLRPAADAILIVTDNLSEDEVVALILDICRGKVGKPGEVFGR